MRDERGRRLRADDELAQVTAEAQTASRRLGRFRVLRTTFHLLIFHLTVVETSTFEYTDNIKTLPSQVIRSKNSQRRV